MPELNMTLFNTRVKRATDCAVKIATGILKAWPERVPDGAIVVLNGDYTLPIRHDIIVTELVEMLLLSSGFVILLEKQYVEDKTKVSYKLFKMRPDGEYSDVARTILRTESIIGARNADKEEDPVTSDLD